MSPIEQQALDRRIQGARYASLAEINVEINACIHARDAELARDIARWQAEIDRRAGDRSFRPGPRPKIQAGGPWATRIASLEKLARARSAAALTLAQLQEAAGAPDEVDRPYLESLYEAGVTAAYARKHWRGDNGGGWGSSWATQHDQGR